MSCVLCAVSCVRWKVWAGGGGVRALVHSMRCLPAVPGWVGLLFHARSRLGDSTVVCGVGSTDGMWGSLEHGHHCRVSGSIAFSCIGGKPGSVISPAIPGAALLAVRSYVVFGRCAIGPLLCRPDVSTPRTCLAARSCRPGPTVRCSGERSGDSDGGDAGYCTPTKGWGY